MWLLAPPTPLIRALPYLACAVAPWTCFEILSFKSIGPQISERRGVKNRIFPIQETSLIQQLCATAHAVINVYVLTRLRHALLCILKEKIVTILQFLTSDIITSHENNRDRDNVSWKALLVERWQRFVESFLAMQPVGHLQTFALHTSSKKFTCENMIS